MDLAVAAGAAATTGGSGGGGPAPFLLKTYEMVDDSGTDEIVSWSDTERSFVVWDPPEFSRVLLPVYFKHSNFSSFIRQLNTYGFHKIDPERWEFANEEFVKGQKHLLKNIHRRKPIHSHSHPPVDSERAVFEEEIEKLSRQKAELQSRALRFQEQQSAAKSRLKDMTQRLGGLEAKQKNLAAFLEKAMQSRAFVELLEKKIDSVGPSAYNKRRRVPQADQTQTVSENSSRENPSSSRPELTDVFPQDFTNKLTLELSPAVSDMNLVSNSTQSSNENWGRSARRSPEEDLRDAPTSMNGLPFAQETVELSDTGTSLLFNMDTSFSRNAGAKENSARDSSQKLLIPREEGDIPYHLNLTLASSPLQVSHCSTRSTASGQEVGSFPETVSDANEERRDGEVATDKIGYSENAASISTSLETTVDNPVPTTATAQVNDHFWEQFLTERPGCAETGEANSGYRAKQFDDNEGRGLSHGVFRTTTTLGKLTL